MSAGPPRSERFTRAFRLRHAREFQAVYATRHRRESGPLLLYGMPNGLRNPRIGLSVSRKVGGAVTRNRIKRRLRDSFRRLKVDLDEPFDYVVVVRPHKSFPEIDFERHMRSAMEKVLSSWSGKPRAS